MKPAAFAYRRAEDAAHAVALLREHGDEAQVLAGGQSLVPMMNFRIARPAMLVDINRCADLAYVTAADGKLRIGAATRQRTAELHPLVAAHCPMLRDALGWAGSPTIRNRGTIGGSLANGFPTAQLLAVTVALQASLVIDGPGGRRAVRAADFFLGELSTALDAGDLLREVVLPCASPRTRQVFRQAGNHSGGAAKVVVCAVAEATPDGLRDPAFAVLGVGPVPARLPAFEAALAAGVSRTRQGEALGVDLAACADPHLAALARALASAARDALNGDSA